MPHHTDEIGSKGHATLNSRQTALWEVTAAAQASTRNFPRRDFWGIRTPRCHELTRVPITSSLLDELWRWYPLTVSLAIAKTVYWAFVASLFVVCARGWWAAGKQLRAHALPRWRAILEILGLVLCSSCYLVYLVVLGHAYVIASGAIQRIDLIELYSKFRPLEAGIASVPLGLLGKGFPRVGTVIVGGSMGLMWLWYSAASL